MDVKGGRNSGGRHATPARERGCRLVHYLVESSGTMMFATLAIAAALLVVGWALLDWSQGISRRWGADGSKGGQSPRRTTAALERPPLRETCRAGSVGTVIE
jgi:hypothetical protein